MAKKVEEVMLGIDVSLETLEVFGSDSHRISRVINAASAIQDYLSSFSMPVCLAVEATNDFHEQVVDIALSMSMTVYVVDGYRLSRYRDAVGTRAKTDPMDARLIYRYLVSERDELRPLSPQNQQ